VDFRAIDRFFFVGGVDLAREGIGSGGSGAASISSGDLFPRPPSVFIELAARAIAPKNIEALSFG
jgi:hypothetical protein